MFGELNPLLTGIVIFTVLAASIIIVVSLALSHRGIHLPHLPHLPIHHKEPDYALPAGADAALWSIVEAVPDPRNHLALTRDLSGEVHITAADREAAAALFSDGPKRERIAPTKPAPAKPAATKPAPAKATAPPPGKPASTRPVAAKPAATERARPDDAPFRTVSGDHERADHAEDDDLVRTSEFFFAGEPRLNRF